MAFKFKKTEAATLEELLAQFDGAKEQLHSFLEEHRDAWQEQYDEKSERWQEGEAAEAASERIEILNTAIDELGTFELDLSDILDA